jgi:hypothetical protein
VGLREVPELEIQERPPSMLRNVDGGPLGPLGVRSPSMIRKCVVTYMENVEKVTLLMGLVLPLLSFVMSYDP